VDFLVSPEIPLEAVCHLFLYLAGYATFVAKALEAIVPAGVRHAIRFAAASA
jgi:hypothetical protein